MNFASDNWAGASAPVREAIVRACEGVAPAYGGDAATRALTERMSALFEREVAVIPAVTGTAANGIALATLCPPNGAILAQHEAHIMVEESGAPEFFTFGARMVPLPGTGGKIDPAAVPERIAVLAATGGRSAPAAVLSLTQATECGTVYTPAEVAALAGAAHEGGLSVHMDGARFANAVAALGCSPAEITWKAGVDALSFGGTKNGALMAEAVVLFDPAKAEGLEWRRRRAGHILSKARLISAQFLALLEDGHWLALAGHANAMARRLSDGLVAAGCRLAWPSQANEVFAVMPKAAHRRLLDAGAHCYDWVADNLAPSERPGPEETVVRFVASFATRPEDVDALLAVARAG